MCNFVEKKTISLRNKRYTKINIRVTDRKTEKLTDRLKNKPTQTFKSGSATIDWFVVFLLYF